MQPLVMSHTGNALQYHCTGLVFKHGFELVMNFRAKPDHWFCTAWPGFNVSRYISICFVEYIFLFTFTGLNINVDYAKIFFYINGTCETSYDQECNIYIWNI